MYYIRTPYPKPLCKFERIRDRSILDNKYNVVNMDRQSKYKYIILTSIENSIVIPSISGRFPNIYPLKSQFIVTKNFIKCTLYCITNIFIILGDIYPKSAIVIANALFVNIVLSANARV